MSKYVAITGGIGSGKSVVCQVFSCLGVPIYDSDSRAKLLMNSNADLKEKLSRLIGNELYVDGVFQKQVMSAAIFTNSSVCQQVNEIVHPCVWNDYKNWTEHLNVPYTIMESALVFESNLYDKFNEIVGVVTSENIRIQRVMMRNGYDANDVVARIKKQCSQEIIREKSDFIIENSNTFVLPQVMKVFEALNRL